MPKQMINTFMADAIGLAVLAVLVSLVSLFVPSVEVPEVLWAFIYVMWAACALFVWRHQKAPERATRWLLLAVASVIGAPIWYGVAVLVARLAFGSNEPELSKTFDILVTLIMAPGLTFIAITGWVRALVRARWMRAKDIP